MTEVIGAAYIGVWLLLLILGFLVLVLARQTSELFGRVGPAGALMVNARLQVGQAAPAVVATALSGRQCSVATPVSGAARSQLILFVSPDCPISRSLLPVVTRVAAKEGKKPGAALQLLIASDGPDRRPHDALVAQFDLGDVDYLLSEELGRLYGISKLPYAVLLNPDGSVAAFGIVNSREHLESLFEAQSLGVASIQDYFELHSGPVEVL